MKAYNKQNIPLAKKLRTSMTPWERKLWYQYLSKYPVRFQRQKAIGNYIVDFYCAKAKLVIELDGGGHYEPAQITEDAERTKQLESMNLRVLRICNLDIDNHFRGVCERIDLCVQRSLPQSAALTAPSSEGASIARTTGRRIFALGFFDGVHLGHQALLKACLALAEAEAAIPAAITFDRHPMSLFSQEPPVLINRNEDRQALLRQFGIEEIEIFPVTKEIMSTNWETFLENLLEKGAAGFVCGQDFRFGHKGEGNGEKLKSFCQARDLPWVIVPDQEAEGLRISSTRIRKLLSEGQMEAAAKLLGHPHLLTGTVVSGRQLGRTIGVPTANLRIPEGVLVPKFGVYACLVRVDGRQYPAVTNVGTRPTVQGHHVTVEPWILDFQGDLYGRELTLEFHHFLRPEEKFDTLEGLKNQIQADAQATRQFFIQEE